MNLLEQATAHLDKGVGAAVLSDYSKGVLGNVLTKRLIHECVARGTKVFVDPKKTNYSVYSNATCITPNLKEFHSAIAAMGILGGDLPLSGQRLRDVLHCETLMVTQGSEGMTLFSDDAVLHLPALAEEVFDVSGAGDTVIACMATAIAYGMEAGLAAELANIAASIVVRKVGTAPVQWKQLVQYLTATVAPQDLLPLAYTSASC
jgi:rfaE bifunctional protein kinase chain/domain